MGGSVIKIPSLCLLLVPLLCLPLVGGGCADKESVEARLAEAQILIDDQKCEEALTILNELVVEAPLNPDVYERQAAAYICYAGFTLSAVIEQIDAIGEGGSSGQELTQIANALATAFGTSLTDVQIDSRVRSAVSSLTDAPSGVLRSEDFLQEAIYAIVALAKRFVIYADTDGNRVIDSFENEFLPAFQSLLDGTCTTRTSTAPLYDASGDALYSVLDTEETASTISCSDLIDDLHAMANVASTALTHLGSNEVATAITTIVDNMNNAVARLDPDFVEITRCVNDPENDLEGQEACVDRTGTADLDGDGKEELAIHFGVDADADGDGICDDENPGNEVLRIEDLPSTNNNITCVSDFEMSATTVGTTLFLSCDFGTSEGESDPVGSLLGSASTLAERITTAVKRAATTLVAAGEIKEGELAVRISTPSCD